MKYRVKMQRAALIFFSIILLLLLLTGCVGEPGSYIQIDNRTDQTLAMFIDELQEVDIPPGEYLVLAPH
ncbi:hypothetical protein ACFLUO_05955 [Chloroflexota bacterium]